MPDVLCTIDHGVATVTLNRPEQRNAFNDGLMTGLLETLERLAADESVCAVVLAGAGTAFSVGADLESLSSRPYSEGDERQQVADLLSNSRISLVLREMPKITIAAIDGACAGAGMGVAMAADLRICTSRAVFKAAFIGVGMSGDFGLAWSLSRLLGDATARQILLEDPRMDAAEALRRGLVTRVVDPADLETEVATLAAGMAGRPPLAVAGIKRNLADAALPFDAALAEESPRHIRCARSADALEAARAFMEKREGVYTGR
jgi:2-(1,2-epoxy-1,2-dihydrophenyl)acetyl-CoA isomerase